MKNLRKFQNTGRKKTRNSGINSAVRKKSSNNRKKMLQTQKTLFQFADALSRNI